MTKKEKKFYESPTIMVYEIGRTQILAGSGEGQLEIGMTKQMCRDSWGEPKSINRTSTRYGNHEQWVYTTIYVYFDNGKISAIQDR